MRQYDDRDVTFLILSFPRHNLYQIREELVEVDELLKKKRE
jgi:hypothetical protein